MMTQQFIKATLCLLLSLLLAACAQQEPIPIYITPTPDSAAAATIVPTVEPMIPLVQTPESSPETPTGAPSPTETDVEPVAFVGPVVGAGYTLPPTATPQPTDTPNPSATPLPASTPTHTPSPTPTFTVTPGPSPTPLPGIDPARIGIQLDPYLDQADWNSAIWRLGDLRVGWLKVQVAWELLQPNGPNEISEDFRRLEIYLEQAHKSGGGQFDVLVSIAKAPSWARTNDEADGPPDNPQALADFITLLLNEMGNGISAIEIWNEPNLQREWTGQPLTGASYMAYFEPAYRAVRAYSPTLTIITAGLAPTGDNPQLGSRDDRAYLQEMYNAGLGRYTDVAIGAHPYSWGNPPDARCCDFDPEPGWDDDPHFFFMDNITDYRAIMERNNHAGALMWVTEFGWATWEGLAGEAPEVWMTYNDANDQANYTLRAFEIGKDLSWMGPMILWNLNFANETLVAERDERAAYSIVLPPPLPERRLYWDIHAATRRFLGDGRHP